MKGKFRDIRIFEIKPENYEGKFDGIFGHVFLNTFDAKNIGYRIAKKLNENEFYFENFDHLYIYLNSKIKENQITETKIHDLGWNKDFLYGLDFSKFNSLNEEKRNEILEDIIFSVLEKLTEKKSEKSKIIDKVKETIKKEKSETEIFLTKKEFKDFIVQVSFKINPQGYNSVMIIQGIKDNEIICQKIIELLHYEDAFYLVDKIKYDKTSNIVTIEPKKNLKSQFVTENYELPFIMENCNCR